MRGQTDGCCKADALTLQMSRLASVRTSCLPAKSAKHPVFTFFLAALPYRWQVQSPRPFFARRKMAYKISTVADENQKRCSCRSMRRELCDSAHGCVASAHTRNAPGILSIHPEPCPCAAACTLRCWTCLEANRGARQVYGWIVSRTAASLFLSY